MTKAERLTELQAQPEDFGEVGNALFYGDNSSRVGGGLNVLSGDDARAASKRSLADPPTTQQRVDYVAQKRVKDAYNRLPHVAAEPAARYHQDQTDALLQQMARIEIDKTLAEHAREWIGQTMADIANARHYTPLDGLRINLLGGLSQGPMFTAWAAGQTVH